MDDLDVLARDFGYRPQGKSAPMRSDASDRHSTARSSSPFMDSRDGLLFNDVFGGPPKYTTTSTAAAHNKSSSVNDFDYDSIFKSSASSNVNNEDGYSNSTSSKKGSVPVYDKPVYDDDIFDGLPGLKSKSVSSASAKFDENVFASIASSPPKKNFIHNNDQFDHLLGSLGRNEKGEHERKGVKSSSAGGFDDLLGNLGGNEKGHEVKSSGRSSRTRGGGGIDDFLADFATGGSASGNRSGPAKSNQTTSPRTDDPFVVLESTSASASSSSGVFVDPLEEISTLGKSGSTRANASSGGGVFNDLDPLNGFGKSVPPFSPEKNGREDRSPSRSGPSISGMQAPTGRENAENSSFRYSDSHSQKVPVENFQEPPLFDMPSVLMDSNRDFDQSASSPPYSSASSNEKSFQADLPPRSEEKLKAMGDIWLTVSEVPLLTEPTKAPPPSRPPPPIPQQASNAESGFFSPNSRKKGDEFSPSYSSHSGSHKPGRVEGKTPQAASQIDELEDFVTGRTQKSVNENANVHSSEEMDAAAAAMKEAMDRAEAKFKHAKEVREREYAKAARSKETVQMDEDEQVMQERNEGEFKENQERLERERQQREKEEEEREQRRLERERARQAEIGRERARQAVERATREARERAAADARDRAAAEVRIRAERAAVEKAQAEARERAGRMAVQRAHAEARERAAAEARERAEKAAVDAREKEAKEKAEARRRAERAAVDKAAAEARERAAAGARERAAAAAAAARMNQQKDENDLESFFSSRASSAPKARASTSDPFFDSQFQSKGASSDATSRTSSTSVPSSNIRKASSTTNIVDDLSSIFGAPPSSGEFQAVEGETEERRRARLERHQRTQERAAKALAEKNQRDLQAQREQEERHRISETLDFEIRRWAAGKEGNLRAMLSTLQYVLWPECGWQPVSLTDLITGASVKKVYRKATLCIHPDKVQQKGATLQQKYIAEKVFDLLKEAWNKFNSEELF